MPLQSHRERARPQNFKRNRRIDGRGPEATDAAGIALLSGALLRGSRPLAAALRSAMRPFQAGDDPNAEAA